MCREAALGGASPRPQSHPYGSAYGRSLRPWLAPPIAPSQRSTSCWCLLESPLIDGFRFHTDVRVRFAETDAQGVVNNSEYLVWFEVARVDYLARFRGGYSSLREQGVEALTVETHVRHLKPAKFDDRLRIHARCVDVRGARFRYEYVVERDGETIADGWTGHACVDAVSFRPTRVPDWLVDEIREAEVEVEA